MASEETHPEVNESLYFAESVRLLWEATRQVVYGGIDTDDLAALCSIVVRLAERRLLRLECGIASFESAAAIAQLRDYRESAQKLLSWSQAPAPEPNWSTLAAKLAAVGVAPLEFQK